MLVQLHAYGFKKLFFIVFCAVAFGGCAFCCRKKLWENRRSLCGLLGVMLLALLPEFFGIGVVAGNDLVFHYIRLEALAQELNLGHFPARIPYLWMDGYGYPSSIMYNDILLYFPAILRLIGFELTTAYLWYVALINGATVIGSYLCFSRIFSSKSIGFILCAVYSLVPYRLLDIYTRAAVGEYSAFCFFPIIALAIWELLYEEKIGLRQSLLLALGMTGVFSVHILSVIVVGIGLLLVLLFGIKVVRKKRFFPVVFGAVGIFAAWNAYFLVPFLDYTLTVPMWITGKSYGVPFSEPARNATVKQIFDYFGSLMHEAVADSPITPGLALSLSVLFMLLLFVKKKGNRRMLFLGGSSIMLLFLISNLCPWDRIVTILPFLKMLGVIQFSWRLMILPAVFLTLLLGECLSVMLEIEALKPVVRTGIYVGILLTALVVLPFQYAGSSGQRAAFRDQWDLDLYFVGSGEYMKQGSYIPQETATPVFHDMTGEVLGFRGTTYLISVEEAGKEAFVQIPVFNYKGYVARQEATGEKMPVTDGENNLVKVLVPEGSSGNVLIGFQEPWYWRLAEGISFLSVICTAFTAVWFRKGMKASTGPSTGKKRRNNPNEY